MFISITLLMSQQTKLFHSSQYLSILAAMILMELTVRETPNSTET